MTSSYFFNIIEEQDIFGQPVIFTFNKKDYEHKTIVGGCVSIGVKLFIFVYACILYSKMISYQMTTSSSYKQIIPYNQSEPVTIQEIDNVLMFSFIDF